MPIAEIISIGTELTTGAKLDTNCQWLSLELSAIGIPVQYHVTVADDLDANLAVVKLAVERSDLVLITGGLGPTLDDLTRDVLAAVAGKPLQLDAPSLEIIKGMFARRNRPMPERNAVQAMFPEGSTVLANPRGTAPGIFMEIPRANGVSRVAAMPGVPSEMKPMFRDEVLPRIAGLAGGRTIRHRRIHTFGLGESAMEELLGDVTARNRDPEVGITAHEATITLRIVAAGQTITECEQKIEETTALITQRAAGYIFGTEDEDLQDVVVARMLAAGQRLSVVESATGGLLAQRLLAVPGSTDCVGGVLVLPSEAAQCLVLEIPPSSMPGTATADAARQLAIACRERFDSDFALAVTDLGFPQAGDADLGPPIAFVGVADRHDGVWTVEVNLSGDPAIQRSRLAKTALNTLRLAFAEVATGVSADLKKA